MGLGHSYFSPTHTRSLHSLSRACVRFVLFEDRVFLFWSDGFKDRYPIEVYFTPDRLFGSVPRSSSSKIKHLPSHGPVSTIFDSLKRYQLRLVVTASVYRLSAIHVSYTSSLNYSSNRANAETADRVVSTSSHSWGGGGTFSGARAQVGSDLRFLPSS